jgi:hypothetical protein
MKATKGLWLHLGLLGAATAVAFASASTKKEPAQGSRIETELWPGPANAVREITYETEDRKFTVLPAKDATGVYAVVEMTKDASKNPQADSGTVLPQQPETKRFIAVDEAEKLIAEIAPAKSYRSLGKIDPARLVDYGLDKPEAKLAVKVSDKTYRLEIGSQTPGSSEYYVRDPERGLVNTFSSDALVKLKYADSRLIEHDMHGFPTADVQVVEITAGGKARRVVRFEGKADAWADPATPTTADETVGNWLLKIQRLRIAAYVEKPLGVPEKPFVRLEYHDKKGRVGYLELFRRTDIEKKYLARSERTRWFIEVPATSAEPIEQDVASVVK